jgi:hypothetical protein
MNSYFKKYIFELIKKHATDHLLAYALFGITLSFCLMNSRFDIIVGMSTLFIFISVRTNKTEITQNPMLNYKSSEYLLLPLTDKELYILGGLNYYLSNFPIILVILSFIMPFVKIEFKTISTDWLNYSLVILIWIILMGANATFRINFKKIKIQHKLISVSRVISIWLIFLLLFGILFELTRYFKSSTDSFLLLILITMLYLVYIYFNIGNKYLNEHKVYSNKNFKWFDYFSILSTVAVIFVLMSGGNVKTRSPASAPKHKVHRN